jgi:predicted secreted protein
MSLISGLAFFFIIWWLVLFTVLPWGARSPHEEGQEVDAGHAPSAPLVPRLALKFAITTLVAGVAFAVFYYVRVNKLITLDTFSFMPGGT